MEEKKEMEKEKELEKVLLYMFVDNAKHKLINEGAYTENARIVFLNYPFAAWEVSKFSPEEREKLFAKMAEKAIQKVLFSGREEEEN